MENWKTTVVIVQLDSLPNNRIRPYWIRNGITKTKQLNVLFCSVPVNIALQLLKSSLSLCVCGWTGEFSFTVVDEGEGTTFTSYRYHTIQQKANKTLKHHQANIISLLFSRDYKGRWILLYITFLLLVSWTF